jgi:hypothetical protein
MGIHEDLSLALLQSAFGDRFVRDDRRFISLGLYGGTNGEDRIEGRVSPVASCSIRCHLRRSVLWGMWWWRCRS